MSAPEARELAHQLIDRLPENQLSGLLQFLETIRGYFEKADVQSTVQFEMPQAP